MRTMIKTQDQMEKVMPSAEQEKKDEESKDDEEVDKEENEKDGDVKLEDGDNENKKAKLPAKKKKVLPWAKAKDKKQSDDVLNLNNEVVKMRKEVKRVRALIIRKMTRQIVNLKKKKGKEADLERNQRRAARLLEEVHAMKELSPDLVTKTALQKNLNFENVCKNPKSTIADRATARIASHPQFNKKIQAIKAAVKAFKEERMKGGKLVEKEKVQKPAETTPQQIEKKEETPAVSPQKVTDDKRGVKVIEVTNDATVGETEEKACSDAPAVQTHKTPEAKSKEPVVVKTCDVKETEKPKLQSKDAEEPPDDLKPAAVELQGASDDDEESDLESSEDEEEKEYFDDSTEERFHKQSSQSEESEEDDFFLGKVSKFKKKKTKTKTEGDEKKEGSEGRSDKLQSELDELESRLKGKGKLCQSTFCSSLAGPKAGRDGGMGRGRGRGRGGDRFRGSKGGGGPSRDFIQQSKDHKGSESSSVSKFSKPCPDARDHESREKGFASSGRGRGRGRGRGDSFRQRDSRVVSQQAPQQALHPSWEASKKRKEQQGQILAFQGKKIKFDDD
ncbi:unnamed protein product [Ophioblennius macclurei]